MTLWTGLFNTSAGTGPTSNTGSPKVRTAAHVLKEMRKQYQDKILDVTAETELRGLILSVKQIGVNDLNNLYDKDQWIIKTMNKKFSQTATAKIQYYECTVWVEKLSIILPEIDVGLLQDFEKDIQNLHAPTSVHSVAKSQKSQQDAKALQKKIKTKYNKAKLDAIKQEYSKTTFHPTCFYATSGTNAPQRWQFVQVNVQENGSDYFLGRIEKIFDKRAIPPKNKSQSKGTP